MIKELTDKSHQTNTKVKEQAIDRAKQLRDYYKRKMFTLDPIKEIDLKNELKRKLWALDGILEHGFDVDAIA